MNDEEPERDRLLFLATEIVEAHVGRNAVSSSSLPDIIRSVYAALSSAGKTAPSSAPEPAVPVKKSVFPDYIICLEDGKKLKTLKRHLQTAYNMTPDEYRERWGLPATYPMVAPNYATQRSNLAKDIGLGRKAVVAELAAPVPRSPDPVKGTGRKPGRPRRELASADD